MKQKELAKKHKISEALLSKIIHGSRFTLSPEVAIDASIISGKRPIDHINPMVKKAYLKGFPELMQKSA